jgi:nucleotide-binding universal stress UspA family protein
VDVGTGRAAHVLAERVARRRAGLVVLGGKRHGRLARAFGGSTAHYLTRVLDIPLLVTVAATIKRVLIAVDLSAAAGSTLAAGIAFARALGAQVGVLHVVEPIRYTFVVPRAPDFEAFLRQSKAALGRLVHRFGIPESDTMVRRGAATDAIIAAAARWRANLIVVGSHGKGFVDRALIGSTTESLLDRLPASLLIVPVVRGTSRRSKRTG